MRKYRRRYAYLEADGDYGMMLRFSNKPITDERAELFMDYYWPVGYYRRERARVRHQRMMKGKHTQRARRVRG